MINAININVFADALIRLEFTKLPQVKKMMDLGSSNCDSIIQTYPYVGTHITFTDLKNSDRGLFQKAMKEHKNNTRFSFVETSCEDLSMFEDNSFDMITFSNVIEHLTSKQIKKTMKGIKRVLKKDGFFILVTPNKIGRKIVGKYLAHEKHIEEFTGTEMLTLIDKYGFDTVNENQGIMKIIDNTDSISVSPVIHNEIDNSYIIYLVCKNRGE